MYVLYIFICTAGRHGDIFHLAVEKQQAFSYRALLFIFVMSADDAWPKEATAHCAENGSVT